MLHDFITHVEYKIANSRGRNENVGIHSVVDAAGNVGRDWVGKYC